ncbi:hypothetical protein B0H16DRAFT_1476464 [Mycena metata]|uniref:Uncharacterized protein n=1 Tax=Mycena metata TaxID=1033252 RepID=A0AAD7MGS5_9AGAR|nr:hypothetical protein B0H16DRAFT_1476464 [Mycena metata]
MDPGWEQLLQTLGRADDTSSPEFDDISCSILVKKADGTKTLEVVPKLYIERSQKVLRCGASTIRMGALIRALRAGIELKTLAFGSRLITELVTGTFPTVETVTVSTTRIADFEQARNPGTNGAEGDQGDGSEATNTGYHFIGPLSELYRATDYDFLEPGMDFSHGDLFSGLLAPESQRFFQVYGPMGIAPETNFILIFVIQRDLPCTHAFSATESTLVNLSDFGLHSRGPDFPDFVLCLPHPPSAYDTDSAYDIDFWAPPAGVSVITSAAATPIAARDLDFLAPPESSVTSAAVTPNSSPVRSPPLYRSGSLSSTPSRDASPYARDLPGSLTRNDLLAIIPTHLPPISEAQLLAAVRKSQKKLTLLEMVQNYRAMHAVLVAFGLKHTLGRKPDPLQVFTDSGGQDYLLSGNRVLAALGWSPKTFDHKKQRYQNGEKNAAMQWSGPAPGQGDVERLSYELWRAVVYFWGSTGPIATGHPPNPSSENADEKRAAALTQLELDSMTSVFRTRHLVE